MDVCKTKQKVVHLQLTFFEIHDRLVSERDLVEAVVVVEELGNVVCARTEQALLLQVANPLARFLVEP